MEHGDAAAAATGNVEGPLLPCVKYRGVRKRKWGKWVSEIREPGKKTRIWLGSFEKPEMAATAYDVATLHLRGHNARLNFPEFADCLPRPASSNPDDIRSAAVEAVSWLRNLNDNAQLGNCSSSYPPTSGFLSSQVDESAFDSPKMWSELAEALLLTPPQFAPDEFGDMEHMLHQDSLWDYFA